MLHTFWQVGYCEPDSSLAWTMCIEFSGARSLVSAENLPLGLLLVFVLPVEVRGDIALMIQGQLNYMLPCVQFTISSLSHQSPK